MNLQNIVDEISIINEVAMKSTVEELLAFMTIVDTGSFIAAYRDWETDRKSTRLNSSHITRSRMPSSA